MDLKKLAYVGAALLCSSAAMADKINVKTGLWEMTTATEMNGAAAKMPVIPPDVLAKMPPEQRARMEQMMKNSPGAGEHKRQFCVTEKDLERGFEPQQDQYRSCKRTSLKVTGTSQEMHMECNGNKYQGTGVMKMNTPDRETLVGTMEMNMTDGTHPMSMKVHMTGKWLSANCGSVKPRADSE